ncbi:hypothetical protein HXP44_29540 [Streptomyces sioyaensis]|nr:hypothetical protein [Streptomyces sioyaensis]
MWPAANTPAARRVPQRASAVPRTASSAAAYGSGIGCSTKAALVASVRHRPARRLTTLVEWARSSSVHRRAGSRAAAYAPSWTAPT